jgi:hypothetical protein
MNVEEDTKFLNRVKERGYIIVGKFDVYNLFARVTATVDNETRSFDMSRELMEEFHWRVPV